VRKPTKARETVRFGNKMFDSDWENRYYYVLDWYVIAALNYRDKWVG
jgi:hypothetical protein